MPVESLVSGLSSPGSVSPRTLIVERGHTGHLLVFVRVLAEFASERGDEVFVALTPDAYRSREFRTHLDGIQGMVTFIHLGEAGRAGAINALARAANATTVVIPHGDPYIAQFALAAYRKLNYRLVLLIMRDPRWEAPASPSRKAKNLFKLALANGVGRRRGVRVVWLREPLHRPAGAEEVAIDPFIADGSWEEIQAEAAKVRMQLQSTSPSFWFGVVGALSGRKNIPLILNAIAEVASTTPRPDIGFAAIGPLSGDDGVTEAFLLDACANAGVACWVDNRVLTNFEMNAAVSALDAVVMAYSSYSPNSTLGKAYVLGTRLVAAGPPSIRRFVRQIGVGWESELSRPALAASLTKAAAAVAPETHHNDISSVDFAAAVLGIVDDSQFAFRV